MSFLTKNQLISTVILVDFECKQQIIVVDNKDGQIAIFPKCPEFSHCCAQGLVLPCVVLPKMSYTFVGPG